jgi:hypothetical protein
MYVTRHESEWTELKNLYRALIWPNLIRTPAFPRVTQIRPRRLLPDKFLPSRLL